MRHADAPCTPDTLMRDGKFHYFIILTIIVPIQHDSVIRRDNALGDHLRSGLVSLRQIFLGQRGSGRLGQYHDAGNSPAASVFDRLNAVDAARDLLAVTVQRVAAP